MSMVLSVVSFLAFSFVSCNTGAKGQEFESEDEMVKSVVGYFLHDVSIQKVDQFKWFTKDIVTEIYGSEENALKEGELFEFIINDPDNWKSELAKAMKQFNEEGKEIGLDWKEFAVDSVAYEIKESDNEKTYYGDVIISSGGQKFVMNFKNLYIHNGIGCYVDGVEFSIGDNGDNSYTLDQEGTFDDFFLSLATCYAKGLTNEIDKIVLVDGNGMKVIAHETMIPSNFSFDSFLPSVQNHNYVAEEVDNEILDYWKLAETYSLDKSELKKSKVFEVAGGNEGSGVMSGFYYTYKGKWYLWHMN